MPRKHFNEIVQPNVEEFESNYGDIRRAFNAVAALDALAGHLYFWCEKYAPAEIANIKDDSAYRQQMGENCPDFLLLRDIAKAQKHVELRRHNPVVSSANQIASRALGWGEAPWGEGRWGGPEQVVVETNSGDLRVVETIIELALKHLESEMDRLNVP